MRFFFTLLTATWLGGSLSSSAQIYPVFSPEITPIDSAALDEVPSFKWGIHSYAGAFIGSFQGRIYPNMRAHLKQQGIPQDWTSENVFFGFGLSKGLFKIDFEYTTTLTFGPEQNDRFLNETSTRSFTVHPAISIFKTRNRTVYLQTGVGLMGTDLKISPRNLTSSVAFSQIPTNPVVGSYPLLRHHGVVLDIALQLIHTAKRPRDLVESFRFGYRRGVEERAWFSPVLTVTGTPIDRAGLLYFQTHIQLSRNFKKS